MNCTLQNLSDVLSHYPILSAQLSSLSKEWEIVTVKGKVYKFDDVNCLTAFIQEGTVAKEEVKEKYIVDYNGDHSLIKADENLLMYKSDMLRSPMGGNIAGFSNRDSLAVIMKKFEGYVLNWDGLIK